MRLVRSSLVVAVVVAALAGCADAPLASSPATADTSSPIPSSAPNGLLGPTTPAKMLSADETRGLESTPWTVVSAAGTKVTIKFVAGGGCRAWKGVRVRQTARSVEIWTTVKDSGGSQACPAALLIGESTIRLTQPLGTRHLLHAPVSPYWQSYIDNF